jgi:hypothetical protein
VKFVRDRRGRPITTDGERDPSPRTIAKLAYILTCLHKVIETEMVEQRIGDLEKFVAHRNGG